MNAFIRIDGEDFPWPDWEQGMQTASSLVDGGRNVDGVFIGRQVGRNQSKIQLQWYILPASVWGRMLQKFDPEHGGKFINPVSYYDMAAMQITTRNMYVSDRTASPLTIDADGNWLYAKNCKLNLIDTGG